MDAARRLLHVRRGADLHIRKVLRLRDVGRQDLRVRQDAFDQRTDRRRFHQRVAVLGEHDRVDYDVLRLVLPELARDRLHARGRGQHADLDCIRHDILKHRVDLLLDHLRADVLDVDHARGILRYDRHDHAHAEHAQGGHRLQIRLDARAAAAIRTGNA